MTDFSQTQVGVALAHLGQYRVVRVQQIAGEGEPDGISGALLLALGLRETSLRNIEGGAVWDGTKWVPAKNDTGWTQINRGYHKAALSHMPGVKAGTWGPVVENYTAADLGYCPRFTDALRFTLDEMHESIAFAQDHGVPVEQRVRFAVAAHNAGAGGALNGYHAGNVDKYTASGEYSAWTLRHRPLINTWLSQHPNWQHN